MPRAQTSAAAGPMALPARWRRLQAAVGSCSPRSQATDRFALLLGMVYMLGCPCPDEARPVRTYWRADPQRCSALKVLAETEVDDLRHRITIRSVLRLPTYSS